MNRIDFLWHVSGQNSPENRLKSPRQNCPKNLKIATPRIYQQNLITKIIEILNADAKPVLKLTSFVSTDKHLRERASQSLASYFGLKLISRNSSRHKKNQNSSSSKAMALLGSDNKLMAHLFSAAVLQNAMAESSCTETKKLSKLITRSSRQ